MFLMGMIEISPRDEIKKIYNKPANVKMLCSYSHFNHYSTLVGCVDLDVM